MTDTTVEERIEQPTGFRAFGWGLGGFIGSNIIINISSMVGFGLVQDLDNAFILLIGILGSIALGFYLAYMFGEYRTYKATRTGVHVSLWINAIVFVIEFFTGLAEAAIL